MDDKTIQEFKNLESKLGNNEMYKFAIFMSGISDEDMKEMYQKNPDSFVSIVKSLCKFTAVTTKGYMDLIDKISINK